MGTVFETVAVLSSCLTGDAYFNIHIVFLKPYIKCINYNYNSIYCI